MSISDRLAAILKGDFWPTTPQFGVRGTWRGRGWAHSVVRPVVTISSSLTPMVYLIPFSNYLAGSKSVFVRPPAHPSVRPGFDDTYRSRSYSFVERQKRKPFVHSNVKWTKQTTRIGSFLHIYASGVYFFCDTTLCRTLTLTDLIRHHPTERVRKNLRVY